MFGKRLFCLWTVLILLLVGGAAFAQEQEEPLYFDVTDYLSSISKLDLAPYKGKVIVLQFYTTASQESVDQLPVWQKVVQNFDPETLEVILVHAWEGEGQPENDQIIRQLKLEGMNIFEDENCTLSHTLGLSQYPVSLFLDQGGSPASGYSGLITYATLEAFLVKLGAVPLTDTNH